MNIDLDIHDALTERERERESYNFSPYRVSIKLY